MKWVLEAVQRTLEIFVPHSCSCLGCLARQHVPTQPRTVPLPALSGAPSLPERRGCSGTSPRPGKGLGSRTGAQAEPAGVPGPSPAGEMPFGWAGDSMCRAKLPGSRRAAGGHGSGSGGSRAPGTERPGFFPMCSQPGTSPRRPPSIGHDKEPVSQKCLLSAAACQPVTEMISRSIRTGTALSHGCGARGRSPRHSPPGRAFGWRPPAAGPRAVELQGREKPGKARKGYGELPLPAHRHLQKQQPVHKSCRGRKGWEALFLSWLSRSWHFHNKLH